MRESNINSVSEGGDSQRVIRIPNLRKERTGTLQLMSWWRQDLVQSAKVLVVGVGALGNEVVKNLTLMGVGHLFLVDRDIVETANLSRSILFREENEGQKKVEVAAARVGQLNPQVQVTTFHGDVGLDLGLGVFRRMDVVIGCLDSRQARLSVNDACWLTGTPWVDGAIQELFGEVRVFAPGRGACYACTLTDLDWQILREAQPCRGLALGNVLQGKVPTTPTIASIIGGIQSQEALKIIHGMPSLAGKMFVFRGLTTEGDLLSLSERPDCLSHYTFPKVVCMKDACVATTTFDTLLGRAREQLGRDAHLVLRNREIVISLRCPSCGGEASICKLDGKLTPEDGPCPKCGYSMREPETTHVFTGKELFANKTLGEVGIPPLDIIEGRSPLGTIAFEMSGDEADVFHRGGVRSD